LLWYQDDAVMRPSSGLPTRLGAQVRGHGVMHAVTTPRRVDPAARGRGRRTATAGSPPPR